MITLSLYKESFKRANIFLFLCVLVNRRACQRNSKMHTCLCASARSIRDGRNSRKASNIITGSICREAKNYRDVNNLTVIRVISDLGVGEVIFRLAPLRGILFI